jgi:hypothetical protein
MGRPRRELVQEELMSFQVALFVGIIMCALVLRLCIEYLEEK